MRTARARRLRNSVSVCSACVAPARTRPGRHLLQLGEDVAGDQHGSAGAGQRAAADPQVHPAARIQTRTGLVEHSTSGECTMARARAQALFLPRERRAPGNRRIPPVHQASISGPGRACGRPDPVAGGGRTSTSRPSGCRSCEGVRHPASRGVPRRGRPRVVPGHPELPRPGATGGEHQHQPWSCRPSADQPVTAPRGVKSSDRPPPPDRSARTPAHRSRHRSHVMIGRVAGPSSSVRAP